ncbi:MAG: exo-alpha-sialidase [Xanthomonadales bacterium]|nr:exo-alpha-sialidase [Xanthomonadales bacterium]
MLVVAALAFLLAACHTETAQPVRAHAIGSEPWHLPAPLDASLADLSSTSSGELLLSWVQPGTGGNQMLMFSRYTAGHWTPPATVAHSAWFGNAMDTPHVRMTADGTLWAQWLNRNANGAMHARDVVLSRSRDDGRSWSRPVNVNTDGTATEHGFTAPWPASRDRLGIAWLDGRATAASGPTMLRATTFGTNLHRGEDAPVDVSTWDCCRTRVAMTTGGHILAYRGRTRTVRRSPQTAMRLSCRGTPPPAMPPHCARPTAAMGGDSSARRWSSRAIPACRGAPMSHSPGRMHGSPGSMTNPVQPC